MKREKFTDKLLRMLDVIDSGGLPVSVKAVYVFGSYARGAMDPQDLDMIILHETPKEFLEALSRELKEAGKGPIWTDPGVITRRIRRYLVRPGERVDLLLDASLSWFVGEDKNVKPSDVVLLWTPEDRDYRSKLEAICPNPTAGRFHRDHLVNIRRLHDSLDVMDNVMQMLAASMLVLTRTPINSIDLKLNQYHQERVARWKETKSMGAEALKVLPYAYWWLESHGQNSRRWHDLQVYSAPPTHRVHIGKPSLAWMLGVFETEPDVLKQCLIPHLRRNQANDLLAFERGPTWEYKAKRGPFGEIKDA